MVRIMLFVLFRALGVGFGGRKVCANTESPSIEGSSHPKIGGEGSLMRRLSVSQYRL